VSHAALFPAVFEAAAQAFAIDGHQLAAGQLDHRSHPSLETGLESVGVQPIEQIIKRVVGRNAVGEPEKGFEPGELGPSEKGHGRPIIGTADGREKRDRDDVEKQVAVIVTPGIGHVDERLGNPRDRLGIHTKAPGQRASRIAKPANSLRNEETIRA
jgi:hypothetical protein